MKDSILKFALLLFAVPALAQQMPVSSQYYTNQFVTNPALAGSKDNVNAFLTHRSQWIGVAGAPQTSYLTVDGPVPSSNIGLGLNLHSDITDITSRVGAFANYSYRLHLGDDNNLFLGIAVGVINNKIDFSKVVVRDMSDPFLTTGTQSKTIFSTDFGIIYRLKKFEIGAAVPQLLANKIKYEANNGKEIYFNLDRSYQASLKYVFDIVKEKEITMYPLIMARYYTNSTLTYDVNAVIDWKKVGWIGGTYHSNNAVAVSAGLRYKNLSVGYAYDFGIGSTKSYTGASSELLLGFSFGKVKDNSEEELDQIKKQQEKDLVTDAAIQTLKEKSDTNLLEIARLKAELAQMKTERLNAPVPTPSTMDTTGGISKPVNSTENIMRTSTSNSFIDENGVFIKGGFYVVIGSFNNKENAMKLKKAYINKGHRKTQIVQNNQTKTYYVLAEKIDKQDQAETELMKYKKEYNDAWILKIE